MDPSPVSLRPFNPPPRLVDTRLPAPGYVPATLTRGFSTEFGSLDSIERQWGPDRALLGEELRSYGENLQSAHWRWTWKADRPAHWHCLVTIECEGQIQGILAVENLLRPAQIVPNGWVLYVDYLEVAPWNYRVPQDRAEPAIRMPRFAGVGTVLIGEAIRMSLGRAAGGRVGLHSLPQAEDFYRGRCGMNNLGRDSNYYDLVYFEYADGVVAEQLTKLGLSA